jgi:hypothetical protein
MRCRGLTRRRDPLEPGCIHTAFVSAAKAAAGVAVIDSVGNLAGFVSPYPVGSIKERTGSTADDVDAIAALVFAGAVLILSGIPARTLSRTSC